MKKSIEKDYLDLKGWKYWKIEWKLTYAHLGLIVNIFITKWGYHNSIIRQFSFYWKLDPLSTLSWHGANVR